MGPKVQKGPNFGHFKSVNPYFDPQKSFFTFLVTFKLLNFDKKLVETSYNYFRSPEYNFRVLKYAQRSKKNQILAIYERKPIFYPLKLIFHFSGDVQAA